MKIYKCEILLAALRASSFACSKIKASLPESTQFNFFRHSSLLNDVPCVNEKEFFQDLEDRATQFFMEWFGSDHPTDLSVRRRIALQSVKDISNKQFWTNAESMSALPRNLSAVESALEPYEKEIKKAKKSTALFDGLHLSSLFYKKYELLKQAKEKNGVVSCEKDLLVDLVSHQLIGELTQRFNQILKSLNVAHSFQTSTPQLSKELLEVRVLEHRQKSIEILPPRPPLQVSY